MTMRDGPHWRDFNVADTAEIHNPDPHRVGERWAQYVNGNGPTAPVIPGEMPPATEWTSGGPTKMTTVTINPEPAFDRWLRRVALMVGITLMLLAIVSAVTGWILLNNWVDQLSTVDPSLWNTSEPLLPRD
jgi:hypothetical protein